MSRARPIAMAIVLAALVASCGLPSVPSAATGLGSGTPSAPPARPTLEPTPVPAWADAAVEHPEAVNAFASQPPGYFCDPCHNLSEDNLFGVVAVTGGFIAVGAVMPPASAIALWSPDGARWTPVPGFSGGSGSAAVALAQAAGRTVLVGHDPTGAAAWSLDPGGAWRSAPAQASLRVPDAAGGMTSVVAFGGGFVAAGYRDQPSRLRSGAGVWRSADGLAWVLDPDPASVFEGGRILGLAVVGDALVAVGAAHDQIEGPAAAWRWTRSAGWRRAEVPAGGGAMRAVVSAAGGLVAVGVAAADDGAAAWTSTDGGAWRAVADQPAFHFFHQPVRMQALVLASRTLVAAGWRSDPGKGSSVVITSADGIAWTAQPWQASFSGGQIDALSFARGRLVAVGRVGYPDTNTAAVWTRSWP